MLQAGSMNERVVVLAPVVGRGVYGEQVCIYEEVATVWARVQYQKSQKALSAGEVWMSSQVVVTTRVNGKINDRCRLKWDGKLYQLESYNRSKADGTITMVAALIDDGEDDAQIMSMVLNRPV